MNGGDGGSADVGCSPPQQSGSDWIETEVPLPRLKRLSARSAIHLVGKRRRMVFWVLIAAGAKAPPVELPDRV